MTKIQIFLDSIDPKEVVYAEIRAMMKVARKLGLTYIRLNSPKADMIAEFKRILLSPRTSKNLGALASKVPSEDGCTQAYIEARDAAIAREAATREPLEGMSPADDIDVTELEAASKALSRRYAVLNEEVGAIRGLITEVDDAPTPKKPAEVDPEALKREEWLKDYDDHIVIAKGSATANSWYEDGTVDCYRACWVESLDEDERMTLGDYMAEDVGCEDHDDIEIDPCVIGGAFDARIGSTLIKLGDPA